MWAAHMQMVESFTFPNFDGIEGRNDQFKTAKASKIAWDVTLVLLGV